MLLQVSALLPLLGLALCAAVPSNLPTFCHGLDCPEYTVITNTSDYELRHYDATKWVSIQKEAATREVVESEMFMTLFHYIDGDNANHVKIPMTAPVLTTVAHGQGPNCASNFTMHFMLPHDQWASPIAPTNPAVTITTLPPMDVYVKGFPGYAQDKDYMEAVMELYSALSSHSLSVDTTAYFTAGYDGPYQFADRHNEVWIMKL